MILTDSHVTLLERDTRSMIEDDPDSCDGCDYERPVDGEIVRGGGGCTLISHEIDGELAVSCPRRTVLVATIRLAVNG